MMKGYAPQEPPWPGRGFLEAPHSSRGAPLVESRAPRASKWDTSPSGADAPHAEHSSSAQPAAPIPGAELRLA